MNAEPLPLPTNLAPALGTILRTLATIVARRFRADPLRAALTIPLWHLLTHTARRLESLLTRLAAGPLPSPRPRNRKSGGPRRKSSLPTTRAWLIRALGHEAAACAAQLETLLAHPAAADLLASTAGRRALAPIRRMLGLAPPRRRRAAPRPAAPRPAAPRPAAPASPAPIPPHRNIDPLPARARRPWWLPPPRLRSG